MTDKTYDAATVEAARLIAWRYEASEGCDNIGVMDPETGVRECHLGEEDCLCDMKAQVADEIEQKIKSLPTRNDAAMIEELGNLKTRNINGKKYVEAAALSKILSALTAAIEPVEHWYQSDEDEPRPLVDILTDIVADLQEDRQQSLKVPALEKLVYIPGVFKCAKCSFVVVKSTMNMQSGTITANDKKGEKCPNDGAPLWRVTYKDQYAEMMEISERICDEKATLTAENERLREALIILRDLPIKDKKGPNTIHLDGVAYQGAVVEWTFTIVQKVKEIATTALAQKEPVE